MKIITLSYEYQSNTFYRSNFITQIFLFFEFWIEASYARHNNFFDGEEAVASNVVTKITELKTALEVEKKRLQEAFNVVTKMKCSAEEDCKAIRWEVVAHVMALKALEGEVVSMREKFYESLQQTIQGEFGG